MLSSGVELRPDFVVLATGSTYPYPAKSGTDDTAAAISRYRRSHDELARAGRVLIVGAGPTGLELAGEIDARWPDKRVTILEPEPDILAGPYKQELRDEVRRQLERARRRVRSRRRRSPGSRRARRPRSARSRSPRSAGRTIEAEIWFRCYGLRRSATTCAALSRPPGWRKDGSRYADAPGQGAAGGVRARRRRRRRPETAARAAARPTVVANIQALVEGGKLADRMSRPPPRS